MSSGTWKVTLVVAALWLVHGAATTLAVTDAELLLALHDKVIRAHRESNVELLLEDETSDYVVANRGEVTRPSLAERRSRLGAYLESTTFREYRDTTAPVVSVSHDGTLGWVIVQVEARGIQATSDGKTEKVEFDSAWVELYQKREGRWYRVGNVSNFRP